MKATSRRMIYNLGLLLTLQVASVIHFSHRSWAETSSSFDANTGTLTIPCVDILSNGLPAGENGSRQSFSLTMSLSETGLLAADLNEITATGNCSATFDVATGTYSDLVAFGDDIVEITLSYSGGIQFSPTSVFFQRDFISDDITAQVGQTTSINLGSNIDTDLATLLLADKSAIPDFITLANGELRISPEQSDLGNYTIRIEWGDQVETVSLAVQSSSSEIVSLEQLPANLPAFPLLNLYSNESVFNTAIGNDPAIDPDSDDLIEGLLLSEEFVIQVGQFSATVFFAGANTPQHDVELPCGEFWELGISELRNVPIPEWATPSDDVDGGDSPPIGCGEESAQDNFLIVLDLENRCEYDFWQARQENGEWVASFGTGFEMDGPGVHPNGMSSRGSGFAFLGGVIWPSELIAGKINHPLAFSYEFPKAGGPVSPATDSDGVSTESFALPEGARLQLDPEFDLSSLDLTDYELTIATAMQEYGLILVDRGGAGPVGFYAVDPSSATSNDYSDIWGDEDFIALDGLTIADLPLRVLELPEQNSGFRSNLQLASNSCVDYQ